MGDSSDGTPPATPLPEDIEDDETASTVTAPPSSEHTPAPSTGPKPRRGKAPPVDQFSGENEDVQLDDWLPVLERAAVWNEWSEEDKLLQLAGHLRGKALQEWSLLEESDRRML